jgi:ferritin
MSLLDSDDCINLLRPLFVAWGLSGYDKLLEKKSIHKVAEISLINSYLMLHGHSLDLQNPQSHFEPFYAVQAIEEITRQEAMCTFVIIAAQGLVALNSDKLSERFIRDLVDEQTEEEASANGMLERTRLLYSDNIIIN